MKRQETILAALYKPIRLVVLTSVDAIRISLNKIPGLKLTSVKTPIDLMNEMPALKIIKKSFYADAKIKLTATSIFERESTSEMLAKQTEFMKQLIEENKSAIRKDTMKKYNNYQKAKQKQ